MIRPAEATRGWMDATAEAFAYRCLPLNIANAHGWEILSPCDAVAYWTGGTGVEDIVVRADQRFSPPAAADLPVSIFGQGVLTFHVQALFRTPPGWDLWIGGSPNQPKEGIYPLSGVVETDWSPYTFTMNWKFTRRNHWVRFTKHEPICFIFPIQRGVLERMDPQIVQLSEDSDIAEHFREWSQSRDAFRATMADGKPRAPAEKWQKSYYRGVTMRSSEPAPGHRRKLRLKPFRTVSTPPPPGRPHVEPMDQAWLTRLLTSVMQSGRQGEDAAGLARSLAQAGLPEALAATLANAVHQGLADAPVAAQ